MSGISIPVVDLRQFTDGTAADKAAFAHKLGDAFSGTGFAAVKNHGITDGLVHELYEQARRFFALPPVEKRLYEKPELAGQRGFTSFGREHAKGYEAPDLKEFFQYGQESEMTWTDDDYPDNVDVTHVPAFTPTLRRAYRAFEQSGTALLQAIALYLQLDEHYFDPFVKGGNSILRAIHYPPIMAEPESALRAEQHEDINLITLLVGASADGLEILSRHGEWVPVTALPEQIVVNVGDMLQRLTNDRLKSTTHRVVNPPRAEWANPRFSIPFFLHPQSGMSLRCLDSCVDAEHPKAYADAMAGEYLDERLREIGLRK